MRVIAVPAGEAPEHIRQQWVGAEIPFLSVGMVGKKTGGIMGGPGHRENDNGYVVDVADAVAALRAKGSDEAADWWEDWYQKTQRASYLVFGQVFCKALP